LKPSVPVPRIASGAGRRAERPIDPRDQRPLHHAEQTGEITWSALFNSRVPALGNVGLIPLTIFPPPEIWPLRIKSVAAPFVMKSKVEPALTWMGLSS
jgi:hypothetical protein